MSDTNSAQSETPRDCEHGQQARACRICELERDLAAARDDVKAIEEAVNGLLASISDPDLALSPGTQAKNRAAFYKVIESVAKVGAALARTQEQADD